MKNTPLIELYSSAVKKLVRALPKFVVFFSIIILLWISSPLILSLGKGVYIDSIEMTRIINIILLSYTLMFILLSFREITQIADAIVEFIIYYSSPSNEKEERIKHKLRKMRTPFRQILYIIVFSILFSISKEFLNYISPLLTTSLSIIIILWFLGALYVLAMTIASEFEERAISIRKNIEKVLKKKK